MLSELLLVRCLVGWLDRWMVVCLVGWLVVDGWLDGWLVG